MKMTDKMEWAGTGFGLMGSLVLSTIGAQLAIALFAVSSVLLLVTATIKKQKSFVLLQAGFLFCNAIGIVKFLFM